MNDTSDIVKRVILIKIFFFVIKKAHFAPLDNIKHAFKNKIY